MKKSLMLFVTILLFFSATVFAESWHLVSGPQGNATKYEMELDGDIIPVAAELRADGKVQFVYELVGMTIGVHNVRIRAGNNWKGVWDEWSPPFDFTVLEPGEVIGIKLELRESKLTE